MAKKTKNEGTKVYGASDDLIEFEGDVYGEVSSYDEEDGTLLVFSDGTLLTAKYGKPCGAVWAIQLIAAGSLFDGIEICTDDEADPHSDVAKFKPGLKAAYAAKLWEKVH